MGQDDAAPAAISRCFQFLRVDGQRVEQHVEHTKRDLPWEPGSPDRPPSRSGRLEPVAPRNMALVFGGKRRSRAQQIAAQHLALAPPRRRGGSKGGKYRRISTVRTPGFGLDVPVQVLMLAATPQACRETEVLDERRPVREWRDTAAGHGKAETTFRRADWKPVFTLSTKGEEAESAMKAGRGCPAPASARSPVAGAAADMDVLSEKRGTAWPGNHSADTADQRAPGEMRHAGQR